MKYALIIAMGALLASVSGCARSLKWTEDVRLPDGRVVTLKRYQKFGGPHEIGDSSTETDYWLEFKSPATGKIVRYAGDRTLGTVALMFEHGTPRLLLTPMYEGLYPHNCPDPPYLLYEFRDGHWQSVPLTLLRGRRIVPNMTYSVSDARTEIESHGNFLAEPESGVFSAGKLNRIVINFEKLSTQVFGARCNPPFNFMTEDNREP
jgi:hypothetical protein